MNAYNSEKSPEGNLASQKPKLKLKKKKKWVI
jgi:hypothetical protein